MRHKSILGVLLDRKSIQTMENRKKSLLSQRPNINFSFQILIFRSKNDASKGDVFSFFNSSSGGYILCKAFLNSLPSFMDVKSSIKWKTLPNFWGCYKVFSLCFPNLLILIVIEKQTGHKWSRV